MLSNLLPNDPRSVLANISGFGLPYDYDSYYTILRQLQLLNAEGICTVTTDNNILPYVSCPTGATKLSPSDIAKRCSVFPQCNGRLCICSPCFHPVLEVAVGLDATVFWPVVIVVIATLWIASWLIQVFQTGASMVPTVPHENVKVLPTQQDLSDTRNGGIKRAHHDGHDVSLVPIIGPDPNPGWSRRRTWQRAADACRIEHPNVLQARGVYKMDGVIYLVQEQVSTTLRQYVHSAPRDVKDLVRLAREIACGMQRLHGDETPILHRPTSRNILIDSEGHVRLQLCEFNHPPSRSAQEDVGHLGWLLKRLWHGSGFTNDIAHQCASAVPNNRPTTSFVLTALTAIEQHLRNNQEKLLNSIIPSFATEALSLGLDVTTKKHESVAILFCDIVGFTSICAKLSEDPQLEADAIIDMLSRLYEAFDTLAIAHEIHKQEIVGDCWVGLTNVLTDQTRDYASRMAFFAIDMIAAANKTVINPPNYPSTLNVRVGIHVGPVTAGVVGITLNPKFCCVGDSMNVTARMETMSAKNCIHLSEAAANKIADQSPMLAARVVPRDVPIDVKGKGVMQTYWLKVR